MSAPRYTIIGASGFIGGHLHETLTLLGRSVFAPPRQSADDLIASLRSTSLGHVVFCAGLTADFRSKPYETVDTHVTLLRRILESCRFESLVYLSSTRVYQGAPSTLEDAPLTVRPANSDDLYNISKLMGEALCLASGLNCKIARLSNVFGVKLNRDSFLGLIAEEAARRGHVLFQTSPESEKDYVPIDDVVRWLAILGPAGTKPIYNLAMGRNTSNAELARTLGGLGVTTAFASGAPAVSFPRIETQAITSEFGRATRPIETEFAALVGLARAQLGPS